MTNDASDSDVSDIVKSHPVGRGMRPAFEALWHLKTLKVVQSLSDFASPAWDHADANERHPVVVVMDTPLEFDHPNLMANIDRALMRDFSVFNEGEFPIPCECLSGDDEKLRRANIAKSLCPDTEKSGATVEEPDACEPKSNGDTPSHSDRLKSAIAASIASEVKKGQLDDGKTEFSRRPGQALVNQLAGAHGTAVAGLIAGRPGEDNVQPAAFLGAVSKPSEPKCATLPYAGINPFARVVPVSLTAAPYPDMVLGALAYVEAIKPDVIVIAAAWANQADLEGREGDGTWQLELNEEDVMFPDADCDSYCAGKGSKAEAKPKLIPDSELWCEVTEKLKSLSCESKVLCAAGNVDSSDLAYPARLCLESGNQIFAVTACDPNGEELSYAPPVQSGGRMIKTLSTQLPRADRNETVVDPYEYRIPELRPSYMAPKDVNPQDVITLDPTGRQGYNPSDFPDLNKDERGPLLEIGSLYARFSGTSAATAIAGGLISLALSIPQEGEECPGFEDDKLFDLEQAKALIAQIGRQSS